MISLLATLALTTAPLSGMSIQPEDWAVRAIPDTKIKLMVPGAYAAQPVELTGYDAEKFASARRFNFTAGKARLLLWVGKRKSGAEINRIDEMMRIVAMAKAVPGFKGRPGGEYVPWTESDEKVREWFEDEDNGFHDTFEPEGMKTEVSEDYGAADLQGVMEQVTFFLQSAIQDEYVLRMVYYYPEGLSRGTAIDEDHKLEPDEDQSLEEAWAYHLEYWYWED